MADRGHYCRKALAFLYSCFFDHSMLFLPGISPILKKDLAELQILYFCCCKFLLYLPQSYRNKKIIRYFEASDIITSLQKLGSKLEKDYVFFSVGPFHPLFVSLFVSFHLFSFYSCVFFKGSFVSWVIVRLYMFYLSYSCVIFLSLYFIYSACFFYFSGLKINYYYYLAKAITF